MNAMPGREDYGRDLPVELGEGQPRMIWQAPQRVLSI
jgi:hypothetical protein